MFNNMNHGELFDTRVQPTPILAFVQLFRSRVQCDFTNVIPIAAVVVRNLMNGAYGLYDFIMTVYVRDRLSGEWRLLQVR